MNVIFYHSVKIKCDKIPGAPVTVPDVVIGVQQELAE